MVAIANAIIVTATAALIYGLYMAGAGLHCFWAFVLLGAVMTSSKTECK